MLPNFETEKKVLTPNLKLMYTDMKVVTSYAYGPCRVLTATSKKDGKVHYIREFNPSLYSGRDLDLWRNLFMQELLHLCARNPKNILIETFEMADDVIAYAMQPYIDLETLKNEAVSQKKSIPDLLDIEKLIKDTSESIYFLRERKKIPSCEGFLDLSNIYKFEGSSTSYFIGDWAKCTLTETSKLGENSEIALLKDDEGVKDIKLLGFTVLSLMGVGDGILRDLKRVQEPTIIDIILQKELNTINGQSYLNILQTMLVETAEMLKEKELFNPKRIWDELGVQSDLTIKREASAKTPINEKRMVDNQSKETDEMSECSSIMRDEVEKNRLSSKSGKETVLMSECSSIIIDEEEKNRLSSKSGKETTASTNPTSNITSGKGNSESDSKVESLENQVVELKEVQSIIISGV